MTMKMLTRVLVLAGVVTLANAHGETTGRAEELLVSTAGAAPVNEAVTASNDFAVDLYRQLSRENDGKNLFFSPYSMSVALAMTAEGARDETALEMGKVLRFPEAARHLGDDAQLIPWNTAVIHAGMTALHDRYNPKPVTPEIREKMAGLRESLAQSNRRVDELMAGKKWDEVGEARQTSNRLAGELSALSSQVEQYELRVANCLWGEQTYPFVKAYFDTIAMHYQNGLREVDFRNRFDAVRQEINAWAETQTSGRIKDLLAKGSLDKDTRLVLVNAIYFKGDWSVPFDAEATRPEEFLAVGARKVSVPMMHRNGLTGARYGAFNADGSPFATPQTVRASVDAKTLYPDAGGFLVAELPYKGDELSMVVIAPQAADGLKAVEERLNGENLAKWLGTLESREVNVRLPKFKLEASYPKMKDTLQAMGMVRAFTDPRDQEKGAQFDGMCATADPNMKLFITDVVHKAFVDVTERGTEAAAATAVMMAVPASAALEEPFTPTFRADRPFLFAIRDMKTGTILFLGRVADPTASSGG